MSNIHAPSRLSQLEDALEKAEQCLGVFNDLSTKASEACTTPSDYFAAIIYRTSRSGSQSITIATRLREIAIEQDMFSGEQDYHKLTSEIYDTYQSITVEKTPLYLSRIVRLREKLLKFSIDQGKLYAETSELRERLPILRKKATPEFLARHEPIEADDIAKNYNKYLPSTLETVQHILFFLPQFIRHFTSCFLEIEGFLLDKITIHLPPSNESKQTDWEGKNNDFNSMLLSDVKKFFTLLTTLNKEGQPFLEEKDVDKFIRRAFIKERDIEKLTLNVPLGEIGKVCSLFYLYYYHCATHFYLGGSFAERGENNKEGYIKLMADNFDNFTIKQITHNFRNKKGWSNPLKKY